MGAIALAAAGVLMGGAGAGMQANSNRQKQRDVKELMGNWQPDYQGYTEDYFNNLSKYAPHAEKLSSDIGNAEMDTALAQREKALPGIGAATQSAAQALFPLLSGELPPSILRAFNSSGAASSLGLGFGGSGFGALNTGLFGARGALGAMQTGYSLLGSLLSTMPRVNAPSTASFLNNIMTPQQRTGDQLAFRQQQIGIGSTAAQLPSANDAWAKYLSSTGGALLGAGLEGGSGAIGMPSGFGGGSSGGMSSPGASAWESGGGGLWGK